MSWSGWPWWRSRSLSWWALYAGAPAALAFTVGLAELIVGSLAR